MDAAGQNDDRDPVEVVFVSIPTSGLGRRMESVLATLQTRHRGRVHVSVVNLETAPGAAERLGVHSVPAVVFLRDRQPVVRIDGRATLQELEAALDASA